MAGDFQSWLNTLAPYFLAAANAGLFLWVKRDVKELAVNTNSKMDKLLKTTATASNLEGNKQGREELKAEQKEERT